MTATAPVPVAAPVAGPVLAAAPDPDGPRVRLGVAWFVVTAGAAIAGPGWLALWLAGAAAHAAVPLAKRWELEGRAAALVPVVPAGAAAVPLAALRGSAGVLVAAVLVVLVALLAVLQRREPDPQMPARVGLAVAGAFGIGLAAAAPVLARGVGTGPALGLLVLVSAYDAGAYLIGTGAPNRWEGPVAGIVAMAVVTLGLAVVNALSVGAAATWWLAGAAAVLAPLGPPVATMLAGNGEAPVPGLRRLDSLLVCGPIWVYALTAALA